MTPVEFYLAAASWGSYMHAADPGACMYAFNIHGCVQNERHRKACMEWIETECRAAADCSDNPTEAHKELAAMLDYLRGAPVCNARQKPD